MKKILILASFVFLFNFNSVFAASPSLTLDGLDTTASGGVYNTGDPNFSTGPITIDYNGRVAFKWWGSFIDVPSCSSNIPQMNQAYFDRHFANFKKGIGDGESLTVGSITQSKTYYITCSNLTASVQVIVRPKVNTPQTPVNNNSNNNKPVINLSANPGTVASGGFTTLTWSVTNATSCAGSGPTSNTGGVVFYPDWSGPKSPTGGSALVTNLNYPGQSYILTCTGPGGSSTASVFVKVNQPVVVVKAPTLSLSATPNNVAYNAPTNLTWTTTNVIGCVASGGWTGGKNPQGSEFSTLLKSETTFTLKCNGVGGTVERSVTVTVNSQAPTVNLSASPISVQLGGSTNLTWTSTNATSCEATGDWTGVKTLNSTAPETISNITTNKTFTLTCKNAQNVSSTASVTISVILPISVTLTASPTSVASGGSTQLTWTTTNNPTTCTAGGDWTGNKSSTGGSQVIMNITQDKTFTITCTKGGLTASASSATSANSSATVKVLAPLNITLTANPNPLAEGGNVTLTWNGDNADSCTASSTPSTTWTGNRAPAGGTEVVNNLQQATNFTITCTKSGVNKSKSVLVEIISVPSLILSASPTSVLKGKDVTLTWLPKNLEVCTASGGWSGNKNKNGGSETITGINENTTFSLACTGAGGNVVKTVTVTVNRESILLTNTRVLQGKTVLKWSATNVENCKATTENPDKGIGWSGNKSSTPSPYNGQTTGVSVLKVSPDTTKYILTCTGTISKTEFSDDVSLHTTSPASSGTKLPVYNEN